MIDFDFNEKCYGCGACSAVCPQDAISMELNNEGFCIPQIDLSKCIKCGICEKRCPALVNKQSEKTLDKSICMAAFRIDKEKRIGSASGGVAAIISEYFIKNKGIVVGCAWDEELNAKHIVVETEQDLEKLKSSKYVQSNMNSVYTSIRMHLKSGKKCIFIGTPCQVGAIKNVFGDHKDLYTIGLICGGVASPKVWNAFKTELEEKYSSKMISANFRSKGRYGWNTPVACYQFKNGKKLEKLSFQLDNYVLQYLYGVFKRKSCFQCGYKGDAINADLILGDYWGSPEFREMSDNLGVSALICKSEKGEWLASLINEECQVINTTLDAILNRNQPLIHSVDYFGDREKFFELIDEKGYRFVAKKYGGKTNPLKYSVMYVLDKTGLFELIKRRIKG